MSIGAIWNETIRLFRRHSTLFMGLAALQVIPQLLLSVVLQATGVVGRSQVQIEAIVAECRRLAPGGALVVHDAFLGADGRAASPRMRAFDHQLRKDNPQHGLRARSEIDAATSGLALIEDTTFDDDQRTLAYRIPC